MTSHDHRTSGARDLLSGADRHSHFPAKLGFAQIGSESAAASAFVRIHDCAPIFLSMRGYRSRTSTFGRNMAGARALWRATGMTDADFTKPIIAIANSFTQFVPDHVHLHDIGQRVKKVIDAAGGWGVEFNTIAVDDGMLYSLPSRDLIAGGVEYMVQADAAYGPISH